MNKDGPVFLTKDQVDALHDYQLKVHRGRPGIRENNLVESAVAQPQHVYNYGRGDHFDVAAAYAYYIAENQPYVDGNKRTGIQAAMLYLQANGIETKSLSEEKTYQLMIDVANKTSFRDDIAQHFRSELTVEKKIEPEQLSPTRPANPYQLSSPEPERKQDQPVNPYKLPGIDDDTGHKI